jgi:hypothetical protein
VACGPFLFSLFFCLFFYLINRKREVIYLGHQMVLEKYGARPNIPRTFFMHCPNKLGAKRIVYEF